MVTKIISGNSIWGLLRYNFEKLEKEKAEVLYTAGLVASDSKGNPNMSLMLKSFQTYLKNNRRTEQPILHISLNPHIRDKLTDGQLVEITKKYMQRMGYGDMPYVIFKHSDIEREHIHIVSLQIDKDGKKIKDSFRNQRSREITTDLEQEYKLHPVDEKENIEEIIRPVDYKKGSVKRQIGNVVKELAESYRFHSLNEYRSLLSLYNVTFEEVKGEQDGKPYHGIVYFATDEKGNKVSLPFKSSLWGKTIGAGKLKEKVEKSKAEEKARPSGKQFLKRIIAEAKRTTASQEKFTQFLAKKNISVIFRANEQGRIYGVTFINHSDKSVRNGSLLGKSFSANAFQEFFTKGVPDSNISRKVVPDYDLPPYDNTTNITDPFSCPTSIFDFSASQIPDEPDIYQPKKKKRRRSIN